MTLQRATTTALGSGAWLRSIDNFICDPPAHATGSLSSSQHGLFVELEPLLH